KNYQLNNNNNNNSNNNTNNDSNETKTTNNNINNLISLLEINKVKKFYETQFYSSLLNSIISSLLLLIQRLSSSFPLLELELSLNIPNVTVNPSLQDLEENLINMAKSVLIQSTSKLYDWGIDLNDTNNEYKRT